MTGAEFYAAEFYAAEHYALLHAHHQLTNQEEEEE